MHFARCHLCEGRHRDQSHQCFLRRLQGPSGLKNWTIYFDAEHGTADNVFTRIGNYNYTNIRAKSRYAPNRKINFNLAVITKDNSNPSEIAGVSLTDFGVNVKSRTFTSSVDWMVSPKLSFSTGYNYNWVNSDAVVDYFYQVPPAASVRHPIGHSLYFVRNNFFFIDMTALSRESRFSRRIASTRTMDRGTVWRIRPGPRGL